MQHRWNILLLASAIAAPMTMLAFVLGPSSRSLASPMPVPDLVEIPPGTFRYRVSGEFTRDGKPVSAPIVTLRFVQGLAPGGLGTSAQRASKSFRLLAGISAGARKRL